jgi:UDP-N-acetylglucosamine 2-epimerase
VKVLSVVGARPNFVKMAPVIKEIERRGIDQVLVHSGQHYDKELSQFILDDLGMPPADYNLGVGSASHGVQTGKILERLDPVIAREEPDVVLVPGDTNTTLAGALAGVKMKIPVAHVEAGVRCDSYYRDDRWTLQPEQINRPVIDQISDFLFCPMPSCAAYLAREGVPRSKVFITMDTMLDAFRENLPKALRREGTLDDLGLRAGEYLLLTTHRPDNVDAGRALAGILDGCAASGMPVFFPAHPRTRRSLRHIARRRGNIVFAPPARYLDFLLLLKHARLLVTDSGGAQKEALWCRTPCITLRNETEWRETVELGANALAGWTPTRKILVPLIRRMAGTKVRFPRNPYGDGHASERIVRILERHSGR